MILKSWLCPCWRPFFFVPSCLFLCMSLGVLEALSEIIWLIKVRIALLVRAYNCWLREMIFICIVVEGLLAIFLEDISVILLFLIVLSGNWFYISILPRRVSLMTQLFIFLKTILRARVHWIPVIWRRVWIPFFSKHLWLIGDDRLEVIELLCLHLVLLRKFVSLFCLLILVIVEPINHLVYFFRFERLVFRLFFRSRLVYAPSSRVRSKLIWWFFDFFILIVFNHVEPLWLLNFLIRCQRFSWHRLKIMLFLSWGFLNCNIFICEPLSLKSVFIFFLEFFYYLWFDRLEIGLLSFELAPFIFISPRVFASVAERSFELFLIQIFWVFRSFKFNDLRFLWDLLDSLDLLGLVSILRFELFLDIILNLTLNTLSYFGVFLLNVADLIDCTLLSSGNHFARLLLPF